MRLQSEWKCRVYVHYNVGLHIPLVTVTLLALIPFYHIKYCVNVLVFVP